MNYIRIYAVQEDDGQNDPKIKIVEISYCNDCPHLLVDEWEEYNEKFECDNLLTTCYCGLKMTKILNYDINSMKGYELALHVDIVPPKWCPLPEKE